MDEGERPSGDETREGRALSPAARRALAEAAARRASKTAEGRPAEIDGRPGPEPVRYGDWERGGRAIDF